MDRIDKVHEAYKQAREKTRVENEKLDAWVTEEFKRLKEKNSGKSHEEKMNDPEFIELLNMWDKKFAELSRRDNEEVKKILHS